MQPTDSPSHSRAVAATAAVLSCLAAATAQVPWGELRRQHLPPVNSIGGVLADFDRDGDLDYASVDYSVVPLRLFVNDGAARFVPHPNVPTSNMLSLNPLAGDIDADGDTDLVLDDGVLLNIAGFFATVSSTFGTVHECADFTGDGRADVFSSNGIWRSVGNGTFTSLGLVALPVSLGDTAAADLDGDGDRDLVIGSSPFLFGPPGAGFEQVWRNNGQGGFTNVTGLWFPTIADDETSVVAAGDLDGDGDADLALGDGAGTWKLRRNDGTGVLQPWVSVTTDPADVADALADLDGDGDLDLPGMSSWLRNDGAGVFQRVVFAAAPGARLHAVGDVNGDGKPDLVGSNEWGLPQLLLNRLPQAFVDGARGSGLSPQSIGPSVVGDFDGDGDTDCVRDAGPLYRNDGSGWLDPQGTGWAPAFVAALTADVDGDGDLDVLGHEPGPLLRVQRNVGNGSWSAGAATPVPAEALLAFDADGDGDRDLLLPGIRLLRNDGTGAFALDPAVPAGGVLCARAAAADFDRDGDLDVLAADTRLHMFVNDGSGGFTWTPTRLGVIPWQVQPLGITPFDADGDGDADAIVTQVAPKGVGMFPIYLLRNVGGTLIDASGLLPVGHHSMGFADAGDLDGDGDLDVIVSTTLGLRHWQNDGTGRMVDIGALALWLISTDRHVLTDIDGDQDLDVVYGDRLFVNRHWHASAPYLPQPGRDYFVDFGGSALGNGLAAPMLGPRAHWPLPFGTLGIDLAGAVPLPLTVIQAGSGRLRIPVPATPALSGQPFGVQALLLDGVRYHLSPVVYDTVF